MPFVSQGREIEMSKPNFLWVDLTVTTMESELSPIFGESFDIRTCVDDRRPEDEVNRIPVAGVCFDFDYPDRHLLSLAVDLKRRFPSIPMLVMTLQHSESLAVWAYRNGMLDYLVKPVPEKELRCCIEHVVRVHTLKDGQRFRQLSLDRSPMPNDVPSAARSIEVKLAPSIYYVQQNFGRRIYSAVVARLCSLSATHFSRAFKKAFTITFQEFLLRYRIAEACRQFRVPGAIISDVAYGVGFSDASYFTRVFRRYVGVSPSEYCSLLDETDNEVWLQEISDSLQLPAGSGNHLVNDTFEAEAASTG
jgi:AraC-like DNA-binding protein